MDIVSWSFQNRAYPQDNPVRATPTITTIRQHTYSLQLYIDPSDSTRSLSAAEIRTHVRQLVSGLKQHGLKTNDCVCVVSLNDIYYTSLFLGIIGAGGCFTGANPGYTAHELVHHLRITQAKFLLTSPKTLDAALAAANSCGIPQSNIFVLNFHNEDVPANQQSWDQLLVCGEQDWEQVNHPDNTPAAYVSTSGTSGLPKAAVISHSYLVSQAEFQLKTSDVEYNISTLVSIPPFHVFTIPVQHPLPLRKGIPAYIMPRFETGQFLDAIEKFQIPHIIVVPPLLMTLAQAANNSQLMSIKRIYVGGSCATDGMQQQLYAKLPPLARIEQVYGMTEVGWATTTWQDRRRDGTGSVGHPIPGTKIVDRDGRIITEEDVKGEIHIHCTHPMMGYLNNHAATSAAFSQDGWVRTGDVGFVRDKKWYVVDRTKDLIKVRGWQVSPVEIEVTLQEHDLVADAAVIGVAGKDGTEEVPVAFVVKAQDSLQEEDIKTFLGKRLARYKGVDRVIFVDSIPRNPTGKILRRVLRDSRGESKVIGCQAAVTAYSTAIKDLDKYNQERYRKIQLNGYNNPLLYSSPPSGSTFNVVVLE
ncbi:hypothetical protein B7463_g6819, partial [Scytalidium lignicola]